MLSLIKLDAPALSSRYTQAPIIIRIISSCHLAAVARERGVRGARFVVGITLALYMVLRADTF